MKEYIVRAKNNNGANLKIYQSSRTSERTFDNKEFSNQKEGNNHHMLDRNCKADIAEKFVISIQLSNTKRNIGSNRKCETNQARC